MLASRKPTKRLRPSLLLLLLSLLLFTGTVLILAAPRVIPRLTSLLTHLRFRPAQTLLGVTTPTSTYRPLTTNTMVPDKYKKPPQAPPIFTGTKESIVGDAKALCDTARALLDKLVADVKPEDATFAKVLMPVIEDENESALSSRILGFYQYVSGDSALRDASTEADKLMDEFTIECNMREDVFMLVDAVFARRGKEELDPESERLLERERKNYIKNGLALPAGSQRDRFKEIKKRLSQLQIEFQKNLNEESGGIWFTPKQLEGVPEDVIDLLAKGTGENEGKLRLTFKYTDLFPTLKFAVDPETRRKLFIDNENKVGDCRFAHPATASRHRLTTNSAT